MNVLPLYYYLLFFACSFVLSVSLTPLVRRLALRTGQVAVPKDTRWHKKETALMGGVGIFGATVAGWLLSAKLTNWQAYEPYLPLLLCAAGIFALGLIDDIFNIDPQHKLAAQIVITSVMLMFGYRLDWTFSKTANLFLTIIWIVGITNAFNLLDNMDGLAAGIALIAGTFLFLTHYLNPAGNPYTGSILLRVPAP